MKIAKLTKKQLSSVPCPTCGVPTGHRYQLFAGGLRIEPHMARKGAAAEAVERKRICRPREMGPAGELLRVLRAAAGGAQFPAAQPDAVARTE